MILVDANLLIYAFSPDSPFHARARLWLEEIMNGDTPVAFPLLTIPAFLRILTHPKLPGRLPQTPGFRRFSGLRVRYPLEVRPAKG